MKKRVTANLKQKKFNMNLRKKKKALKKKKKETKKPSQKRKNNTFEYLNKDAQRNKQ